MSGADVSPADTIQRAIALGDQRTWAYDVNRSPRDFDAAYAALAEWEAVWERDKAEIGALNAGMRSALDKWDTERERDRRHIARLTEALDVLCSWQPSMEQGLASLHPQHRAAIVAARAVLAGEEDADNG